MRARNKLSTKAVEAQKVPGRYADGGGLYLQVAAATGGTSEVVLRGARRVILRATFLAAVLRAPFLAALFFTALFFVALFFVGLLFVVAFAI